MSSNLMDTEPGGKNTAYESIKTVTNPPAKEAGQFGGLSRPSPSAHVQALVNALNHPGQQPSDHPAAFPANTNKTATSHVTAAEKIRFGQALSEQGGVSGHTAPAYNGGEARHEGGYGGTESLIKDVEGGGDAVQGVEGEGAQSRRAQGYGGERDVRRDVGA